MKLYTYINYILSNSQHFISHFQFVYVLGLWKMLHCMTFSFVFILLILVSLCSESQLYLQFCT